MKYFKRKTLNLIRVEVYYNNFLYFLFEYAAKHFFFIATPLPFSEFKFKLHYYFRHFLLSTSLQFFM